MVQVRFTDKRGKSWIAKFPKRATMEDVRIVAKRMNPNIKKVEYYRKKKKR